MNSPQEQIFNALKAKGLFKEYKTYENYLEATGQPKIKKKFEDTLSLEDKERFTTMFGKTEGS
jgi:hypothetical protein